MDVCFNGQFFPADAPLLPVQNPSYKWGEGLFETMWLYKGRLLLSSFHFERLFAGMQLLQLPKTDDVSEKSLTDKILTLAARNGCTASARVRLAVYRHNAAQTGYSIEVFPLSENEYTTQVDGLVVGLYPYARKAVDAFANLKSANYLPYAMAARFATEKGWDEALLLNTEQRFCEASKANLFLLKDGVLSTPALADGCVNGVMRRVVLQVAPELGFRVRQTVVDEADLLQADEVFLTNAIQLVRWVRTYKDATYTGAQTQRIRAAVAATIFPAGC